MCGRFSLTLAELTDILERFGVAKPEFELKPRYNLSPGQDILIIFDGKLQHATWGFVPSWAKDTKRAVINARGETVAEKGYFKSALKTGRCLILADGFYEWDKEKHPWWFRLKDEEVFAFAGIVSEGEDGLTCAIITTQANAIVGKHHDRMPVILPSANESTWLQDAVEKSVQLLKPFPASNMTAQKLTKRLNSACSSASIASTLMRWLCTVCPITCHNIFERTDDTRIAWSLPQEWCGSCFVL